MLTVFCIKFSMRNTIQYYYNIEVDELEYKNNNYYFGDYILTLSYRDIDEQLYKYVSKLNLNNYDIILNNKEEMFTIINHKRYFLLKKKGQYALNFNNLERFTIPIKDKQLVHWDKLWENKIDYYEKLAKTLTSSKVKDTFHYYVGLGENAISLYKMVKQENIVFLSHSRLFNDEDYLNPINYIVDYRARDVAEYTKRLFFENRLNINDLYLYFNRNNFSSYDYVLFYIRLLYPSYYFDAYDRIVNGEEENLLDTYIKKINEYENFLRDMYFYIKSYAFLPKIDWLINKKNLPNDKFKIHPCQ